MSPSPHSDRYLAIRQMSLDLVSDRKSLSPGSHRSLQEANNDTRYDLDSGDFSNPDDVMESTRQIDEASQVHNIRTTAQKYRYYNANAPESAQHLPTSAVNRAFHDFDQDSPAEDESESMSEASIEVGRGASRSARNTPSRRNNSEMPSNALFSIGNDSLYEITATPPARPRAVPRKNDGAERGSLRRDAITRRAASMSQKEIEANMSQVGRSAERVTTGKSGSRRRLADMHAKAISEDDGSLLEDRPPVTTTMNVKNTRFSNPRSRQASSANGVPTLQSIDLDTGPQNARNLTPRRDIFGTPRSTQQSFMLPDIPNLTELVSGSYKDGTPVFDRAAAARSRFTPRRGGNRQPKHIPVDKVPIPDEEKAIIVSLQLLKDKVAQLEEEKTNSQRRIEEYETQVIELKAELQARDRHRRSDSALGSTDGESGKEKNNSRVEKFKVETQVQSLQTRLERAERKASTSELFTKRMTQERDDAVTQLGVAFIDTEELKSERDAFQAENNELRNEVDNLRAENDSLRDENDALREQLDESRANHEEETRGWTQKEADLQRKMRSTDREVLRENETMRVELEQMRAQHDNEAQRWTRQETELRRKADKKAQIEHAKLQSQNEELKTQLAEAKAHREQELKRWASKEAEMRNKIENREETIRQIQDMTQEEVNETLRQENEGLKVQLAELKTEHEAGTPKAEIRRRLAEVAAEHDRGTQEWVRKEAELRQKIGRRDSKMRELAKDVQSTRQSNMLSRSVSQPANNVSAKDFSSVTAGKRKASEFREQRTISEEVPKVQPGNALKPSRTVTGSIIQSSRDPKSKSKLLARPAEMMVEDRHQQAASMPVSGAQDDDQDDGHDDNHDDGNDTDSTTDLNLDESYVRTRTLMRGAKGITQKKPSVRRQWTDNMTELSDLDDDALSRIRRTVEEEHIAAHKRRSLPPQLLQQNDTVRSSASIKVTGTQTVPRKSSMKELTDRITRDITDALDGDKTGMKQDVDKQDIDNSIMSNMSRRRRCTSAPAENMTSAFILPDITVNPGIALTSTHNCAEAQHKSSNCTICRRQTCTHTTHAPLNIPTPVPVSTRETEIDATLRPTQAPKEALAVVLKSLQDELAHLRLELRRVQKELLEMDPAMNKRKREARIAHMDRVTAEMNAKMQQIYGLHDVLEGFAEGGEMEEEDVDRTLEELGIKKGTGKRVTIEDVGDEESGDDLPFEGFSEAESTGRD